METPEQPQVKLLYTPQEAADRLGVKLKWIYNHTRDRRIPHRRLGKYIRFSDADLRWIADQLATIVSLEEPAA